MTAVPAQARVILYTRDGCHLCADARMIVEAVCEAQDVGWRELDVDADPDDRAEYGDLVPVVLVDGVMLGYYEVAPERLRAALAG